MTLTNAVVSDPSERAKLLLDSLLAEARQIHEEILAIQAAQRGLMNLSLTILGVGITFFAATTNVLQLSIDFQLLFAMFFLAFAFVYELMALIYVGHTRGILRLSRYIVEYLSPNINQVLGLDYAVAFQWEDFVRRNVRQSVWELMGFSLYALGEFSLIIIPSLLSLIAAAFIIVVNFPHQLHWLWVVGLVYLLFLILIAVFAFLTIVQSRKPSQQFLVRG